MGRFETTAEFYRYREPYPPEFFAAVSTHLGLSAQSRMLDVGCGPGNLAIGFAPFVGNCMAVDVEPAMLALARHLAGAAGADIQFAEKAIENLDATNHSFDFITIGRALHWLPREATLSVLERTLSRDGHIAVCASFAKDSNAGGWQSEFRKVRSAWASEHDETRYKPDLDHWFAPSRFRRLEQIAVAFRQRVGVSDLIKRALSFSVTSPAVLGKRRIQFEAALESALKPFALEGAVDEDLTAVANIFTRLAA